MTQTEEILRMMPGAELFFGESVAQFLADISDEAYTEEAEAEGFLLGRSYHDSIGNYAVVSGVTQNRNGADSAVGYFRSSLEGCGFTQKDVRRCIELFGYARVYAIIIDASQGAMAMYVLENGVARKVPSAMLESL